MQRFVAAIAVSATLFSAVYAESARSGWSGLFDVDARTQRLEEVEMTSIKAACLAVPIDRRWMEMDPVLSLGATDGYGSDNAAEDFSWAVMVLSGRALAADDAARATLESLLLKWAEADAFSQTADAHDAYYALKRALLPITTAYAIVAPEMESGDAARLRNWIDPLVRRIDKRFDGDVDVNNHRVLADSVQTVWGGIIGDEALVERGVERFHATLEDMRSDGTLPLEARRGARALWYQRQTLSSLAVIAEVLRGRKRDLYSEVNDSGRGFTTLLAALLDGLRSPLLVTVYSAENYIPGPEDDYLSLDLGFLHTRGHGRHYMAWTEAALDAVSSLPFTRLRMLFHKRLKSQRPLIDEFAGGNATCFWGRP